MSLVSIVVPVYKVEKYLHRCVDSILGQTLTDFKLILVDDGSPDTCGKICDEYAVGDSRIHVIHQLNGGLSAARNAGIDWIFARHESEWITFIDSDDWVHPIYLEALYSAAIKNSADVVIGGYELTDGKNPEITGELIADTYKTEEYYVYNIINATVAWGKLYRLECFNNIRYPMGRIHEDEFVTYRILFRYDRLCVIPQPLYAYFQNTEGIILSKWTPKKFDSVIACEKQVKYFARRGYHLAAKERFISLIHQLLEGKIHIKECADISSEEKKAWIRKLDRKKRKLMLKYQRFRWITIRDKGFYLQAYDSIFPPFKVVRSIGLLVKELRNGIEGKTGD